MRSLRFSSLAFCLTVALLLSVVHLPASAQGIIVKSEDVGCIDIPATQFSWVKSVATDDGDYRLCIGLTDNHQFTLGTDAVIEAYEGTFDGGNVIPGTVPSIMEVNSNFSVRVSHLSCERLPHMTVPRAAHQLIPSGDVFVAVGGHTTGFELTPTAELFDGKSWRSVPIASPHDDGYSAVLPDGRVIVGGGYSENNGGGYSRPSDIYDPVTQTFTLGPRTILSRARAKAIAFADKVYVSGNWHYDLTGLPSTPPFDVYNGTSFSTEAAQDPRSRPYLFPVEGKGILEFAPTDYDGNPLSYSDGVFKGDYYMPASKGMYYMNISVFNQWTPLELPADARPTDSQSATTGNAYVLGRHADGNYGIIILHLSDIGISSERYSAPSFFPPTHAPISFRGGSFVCDKRQEAYFVGSSGNSKTGFMLYLMTFNFAFLKMSVAIGDAGPFPFDPVTASWLLLPDGRLVMTGGYTTSDAVPVTDAWVFTPPRSY